MEGLRAYNCFMALKLHFTTDYDYFRYSGKVRKITPEKFSVRKDSMSFQRLERRYGDDVEKFFVANFVLNKDVKWVGNLSTIRAEEIYTTWNERMVSLTSLLENDLKHVTRDTKKLLLVNNGTHPPLLKEYLADRISVFTLIMMNEVLDFLPYWNKEIRDTIIWPDVVRLMTKTRPFLHLDKPEIRNVVRKMFIDNIHETNYTQNTTQQQGTYV